MTTVITDPTFGTQTFTSSFSYDAYGRRQSATHQHAGHGAVALGYGYNA